MSGMTGPSLAMILRDVKTLARVSTGNRRWNQRQETETVTVPAQPDPFADPIIPPSTRPTIASLRGRLVMITPKTQATVPDRINEGTMKERITADVTVVDGLGPVPLMKGNPPRPTGQFLDGPDFTGMWIESTFIVDQLSGYVGKGKSVLAIVDTKNPGTDPLKGNPWGLIAATPEQKAHAVNFLNSRTVGAAAPPFQPQAAPVAQQAPAQQYQTTPSMQQYVQPAQQYQQPPFQPQTAPPAPAAPTQVPAPAPVAATAPAPGPVANPFLQQQAPAPAAQPVNPFLQQAPQQ
jgi:hypothetical protein